MAGKLIAFEGIDGAGKTTVAGEVIIELRNQGLLAVIENESHGVVGQAIRYFLQPKADTPHSGLLALLFAAARLESEPRIEALLKAGHTVLSDRNIWSTFAYHEKHSLEWLQEINRYAISPDLHIVLDVDPEVAAARFKRQYTMDIFERSMTFQHRVRKRFLDLAATYPTKARVVNANQPIKIVVQKVMQILREEL